SSLKGTGKGFQFSEGTLQKADNSVLFVDEIDKMDKKDQEALLSAKGTLENQFISQKHMHLSQFKHALGLFSSPPIDIGHADTPQPLGFNKMYISDFSPATFIAPISAFNLPTAFIM
ncbi:sigma 54-interacting transcriptional regulator, partial [Candidatus Pacearchaeota archaeon]|nr:sigma 54-interacting transcriptional regulator [Candidatus Pacearchaeota archaeon]